VGDTRIEPFVVPKQALTGENTERVDTRVLQVLYAIESRRAGKHPVYVGQQLDVFIDGNIVQADSGSHVVQSTRQFSAEGNQ
jgi:hypothetical protein